MKHTPIPRPSGSHRAPEPQQGARAQAGDAAGNAPSTQAPAASFVSRAMLDIAAARADQLRFGHTPEADRAKPVDDMAREISRRATIVREDAQFNYPRPVIRRHAVALAALLVALVDRLDADEEAADADPFEDFSQ